MKNKILIALFIFVFSLGLASCGIKTETPTQPETQPEVTETPIKSYSIGFYTFEKVKAPDMITNVTKIPNNLPVLEVEGFNFEGWYYDFSFTEPVSIGDELESNVTLYAKFTIVEDSNTPTVDTPTNEPTPDVPTQGGDEPTPDVPTQGGDEPTPDVPTQGGDELPDQELTLVENPQVNKAYKLSFYSTAKSTSYYFIGTMKEYYGATSTNPAEGVDMKLETVTGGYSLYFLNSSNTKQYINIETNESHINFVFRNTASTVWTWDSSLKALVGVHNGATYFMGTYENYTTFGMSAIDKAPTSYVAQLFIYNPNASGGTTPTPDQPTDTPNSNELTIAEFINKADTVNYFTLTGTVSNISNTTYGNFDLVDSTGTIYVYGLLPSKGSTDKQNFQNLNVTEGCVIKISGTYLYYNNSKHEVMNAYLIEIVSGGGSTPDNPTDTPVVDELKNVKFESIEEVYVSGKTYTIAATNIPTGMTVEYVGNNVTGAGNHLVTANFYDAEHNLIGSLYAYIKVVYQVEFPEI